MEVVAASRVVGGVGSVGDGSGGSPAIEDVEARVGIGALVILDGLMPPIGYRCALGVHSRCTVFALCYASDRTEALNLVVAPRLSMHG